MSNVAKMIGMQQPPSSSDGRKSAEKIQKKNKTLLTSNPFVGKKGYVPLNASESKVNELLAKL